MRKDTSVRINGQRRNKLEMLAIEISHKSGRLTKMSDIVNHLIDNYINEAKQDLIHQQSEKK
ncbi:hypothetical protein HYE59_01795 [Aggregatibacter actinomycetemcomitans]|uniref:hypothetical protein n=1 Tax=Aggregatibacter actinomycetemcomitans TaxID=714 RepID=UPI0011D58BC8|nr:hypothetical protein [Aggregatibacter actinomycetemcomitans]MBN6058886.1 hypothetical protein [Aggregatibacter actinomycetemcomitans]MBN6059027.1 hypothetical protein [Aggregatibacter actinomycetemcomitans]MBN6076302.1 hypothetical protein [Aggregatibacter actinomycetemcomitans]MBN6087347.1 hypothetical protein [Aggregatibacter actinomycetemcomitans]MBN6087528.1 hypothetical protein [Aggregatibacter actinomycetemcomitans]